MIHSSRFIISAVDKKQYPNHQNFSEFAFFGRSNVGKSILVNALVGQKLLAKVSSKPGKTQTLNFFLINDQFYFVDVPGYGYAQRSQEMRKQFGLLLEQYLNDNQNLKIVFLLVDFKVGPTADDLLTYDYLKYLNKEIIIVATKADKIGTTLLLRHKKAINAKIDCPLIITSAHKKTGINQILEIINNNQQV